MGDSLLSPPRIRARLTGTHPGCSQDLLVHTGPPDRDLGGAGQPASRKAVKLGLHLPSTTWEGGPQRLGSKLAEVVQAAEAAGFDSIDVADHLWQHPLLGGPQVSQVEAYTTLGFIAAHTRRVRLFALATAVSYRHAGLLAKM